MGLECTTIIRIGGVKRDIPVGFADRLKAKVQMFEKRIDEYEMLLDESTIFLVRLQGVGYATAEDMIDHGYWSKHSCCWSKVRCQVGASILSMMKVDWEPAVEKPTSVKIADCYDRYRARMFEMRQCCRMILDAIDKIPGGANTHYANDDEMILAKAPTRAPEGATGFSNYECTRGSSQFYIQGGGEEEEEDAIQVVYPFSYCPHPYVAKTMIGYKVADIPAIMGSFDPCIGETDRFHGRFFAITNLGF